MALACKTHSGTMNQSHFFVLGVNHITASVELRDKLLFGEEELKDFSASLIKNQIVAEVVTLSTCNRTEIYGISQKPEEIRGLVEAGWGLNRKVDPQNIRDHAYYFSQSEAITHLFRVIGSLDSLVLGETQILGQVKAAYQLANQLGTTNFYLNHIFQAGFRTGKRLHAETAIHEGAVSISYAAVELARKVLGHLAGLTVGLVGTGEMGQLTAQHLHKAGTRKFLFFNRSRASAEKLAVNFGGEVYSLEELPKYIAQCDILVSATGAPGIIITREQVERHKTGRSLFLIDIAAPRDIESGVGEIEGVFLFTIDDLMNSIQENAQARRFASQKAMAIVEAEVEQIEAWEQALDIVPIIKGLRQKYQDVLDKEIHKWESGLTPEFRKTLEDFGRGLVNKLLHEPVTGLKRLGEQGDGNRGSYYANLLFSLNEEGKEHGKE